MKKLLSFASAMMIFLIFSAALFAESQQLIEDKKLTEEPFVFRKYNCSSELSEVECKKAQGINNANEHDRLDAYTNAKTRIRRAKLAQAGQVCGNAPFHGDYKNEPFSKFAEADKKFKDCFSTEMNK